MERRNGKAVSREGLSPAQRSAPDLPWPAPHASKEAYDLSAVAPPSPTQLLTSRVFATRVTTSYRSLHCMHDKKFWCPPAHLSTERKCLAPRYRIRATTTASCRRRNRRVLRITEDWWKANCAEEGSPPRLCDGEFKPNRSTRMRGHVRGSSTAGAEADTFPRDGEKIRSSKLSEDLAQATRKWPTKVFLFPLICFLFPLLFPFYGEELLQSVAVSVARCLRLAPLGHAASS